MKKHVFWRLFNSVVLTAVVWSAMGMGVYGAWNDSSSGGTLLDVFRGRSSNSPESNSGVMQETAGSNYSPEMNYTPHRQTLPAPPAMSYPAPAAPSPQPAVQNKWSIKSWFAGAAPVQPQTQYVEPAPPLTPSYTHPHSHALQPTAPNGQTVQYPVVPLDSQDFRPQEGAIYNEKGEMIYNPESGEPMPNFADGEMLQGNGGWQAPGDENMQGGSIIPLSDHNAQLPANNVAAPINESDSAVKRIIVGRSNAGRSASPVNQERVYSQQQIYPEDVVYSAPKPISTQAPVNPYAQQPTTGAGNSSVGTGKVTVSGNSGALKLDSGASAFSKTYKPLPRVTSVPADPVMNMAGPELAEALPQELEAAPQENSQDALGIRNSPSTNSTPHAAIGAQAPTASPIIEELHNASPLENLTEKNSQTPTLEPVPETVPEIDVPKEKSAISNEQLTIDASDAQTPIATPKTDNRQETAESSVDESKRPTGADIGNRAGSMPHGQNDEIMSPKKLISAQPTSNREPTLSARTGSGATPSPLIIEIDGPDEVEFGKNEMFSLSVINTTDAVRRDIVLSVHPEGFGSDKTASLNLDLAPNEKKSVYMKLNARQYNNLSLTAQVRDALGFETTKSISVNVKDESVKISILPPQSGSAYVGQPTEYLVRIVNNADKNVSFNAMAFFGNGIEPIRASGAPNTIQSGQVVVNKPIELKQGEMRDLKIIAVAFQPGIHKILVQLIDSRGATYAAKESCAYRQREFDEDETETIETDAKIELTPGKSEIGVWKPAMKDGNEATIGSGITHSPSGEPDNSQTQDVSSTPSQNSPDAVPLTQPDQGPKGDLIMPMFAQ